MILTAGLLCFLQLTPPAIAQTTMLTGSVVRSNVLHPIDHSNVSSYPTFRVFPANRSVIQPTGRPLAIRTVYLRDRRSFWQRHPMAKSAAIGAGVGAGVGAATGLISGRSVLRGAAIGAGAGAGVGVIRSSRTLRRHPIIRDVATGTVTGLGIGWAAGRHHSAGKGALIGAAAGLGVGLLRHLR